MADSAASTAAPGPAAGAAGQEPVSVVKVVPEHFKIDVVLNEEVFLELTLHNTSSSLCTFKVKTTARDRYLLRPTQDYIPPHGSRQCKIVMAAMRAYPDLSNPKNLKDKFLVQATNIDAEVPDLTRFWKELETQHNPKAGVYKYAETKIKCKLSVPAKYRAADATKRGEEAEQAAAAAAAAAAERNAQLAALSVQQQQQQQQQQAPAPVAQQARVDDFSVRTNESGEGARRKPSNDAADFAAMALAAPPSQQQQQMATAAASVPAAAAPVTLVPMASHAVAAAIAAATAAPMTAAPSSASVASSDANAVSRQLAASEAKYAELMEFVVKTTAQLEKERADRESWEGRAQQAAQALAQTQIRLESTESKLIAAREDLKRAVTSSASSSSSSSGSGAKGGDEGAELTRRRGKSEGKDASPLSDDDDRSSTAKKLAAATAAVSPLSSTGSGPSTPLGGALASKQPAGLTLPLWQIALMALVCFVLGRIFG